MVIKPVSPSANGKPLSLGASLPPQEYRPFDTSVPVCYTHSLLLNDVLIFTGCGLYAVGTCILGHDVRGQVRKCKGSHESAYAGLQCPSTRRVHRRKEQLHCAKSTQQH